MRRTADEVVSTFFNYVEHQILTHHVDWEINGIIGQRDRGIVVAIGSLFPKNNAPPLPFLLTISGRNNARGAEGAPV